MAHPCDETSLRGRGGGRRGGPDRAGARRTGGEDPRRRRRARHRPDRADDRRRAAQPRRRRLRRHADPRGQGRAPDEGQPAHRRADARSDRLGDRPADRPADQPRLHHGRAGPPRDAVHHRRRDQHLPRPRCQARHRPERHRPLGRHRHGHAAGRDPVGGRDGDDEDPLDHRGSGALQDGRPRADHRRAARRAARLRQRHRSRGGADQGHHLAGRRPRADPRGARPRGRQHAGEEPELPRPCRRRRASCSARACRSS